MTVKELIDKLEQYPPDRMVLVSAYEENYDELKEVREVRVHNIRSDKFWRGDWDDYPDENCDTVAVLLPRP